MKLLRDIPLRTVPVVEPQTSLAEVIELMENEPLQTVVIVGDGMYLGIYTPSDRDSGRIPADTNRDALEVGPYASGLRFVGAPDMTTEAAHGLMARHDLPVLPVVAGRIYKGVLTTEDL
ncbi:MAG: CBS domain-containing protein [Akkermansiaceae bacterium]|nr:CBS domain-containing protein [Armatimonadota bacterium]